MSEVRFHPKTTWAQMIAYPIKKLQLFLKRAIPPTSGEIANLMPGENSKFHGTPD
jgi:hypothetical protein